VKLLRQALRSQNAWSEEISNQVEAADTAPRAAFEPFGEIDHDGGAL